MGAQFAYGQIAQLRPSLLIRRTGKVNEVQLTIPKGVFAQTSGGSVSIKFDNSPPTNFTTAGTADDDRSVLFIDHPNKFILKTMTAKKILIAAEFYRAGRNIIEFHVSGLKWDN